MTLDNTDIPAARTRLRSILIHAVDREASDVHLVPGFPVCYRVHGLLEQDGNAALDSEQVLAMIKTALSEPLGNRLDESKNHDFSISLEHRNSPFRFRTNIFLSQGRWCACLRHVPDEIPSFEWMGFPAGLARRLVDSRNGLVIITGVTGSGKSTTLAALIHLLNQDGGSRVITVEEPIEYIHKPISSTVVTQREVGRDVDSFLDGLKFGLRQDPDVILIGEIRDSETARMALSAAETGHLILTTLHTKDAKGAVTRFIDLFPHEVYDEVRTQLSLSLRSVISQHLLPSISGTEKRALALEVLHVNQAVRVAIKSGRVESIESAIQTGRRDGMVTLDDDLMRLAVENRIDMATARRFAKDPEALTS